MSSGTSRACLPASSSYYLHYGAEGVWEDGPGGNSRGSKPCAIWAQGPRGVERWGGGAWGYGTLYSSYACGLKAKMKASAVYINILHLKVHQNLMLYKKIGWHETLLKWEKTVTTLLYCLFKEHILFTFFSFFFFFTYSVIHVFDNIKNYLQRIAKYRS